MDLVDETKLSSEQMRVVLATLMFDGNKQNLPHPDENWKTFIGTLSSKMKTEKKQYCVRAKCYKPWVDVKVLTEMYGNVSVWGGGGARSSRDSAVCSIS